MAAGTRIDALADAGGQCAALYPEKPIYDIPGYPSIDGQTLVDRLVEQAAPFAPDYLLDQQVMGLARHDGGWRLSTSAGREIQARAVIVAAGIYLVSGG